MSPDRLTAARLREAAERGEAFPSPVRLIGRLMLKREMGKASFGHLQDSTGRFQIYLRQEEVGPEKYKEFVREVNLGDILGVEGTLFTTKTGEPTLRVTRLEPLAKAIRPLPDKWHGLKDVEQRYRQRHLDLILNPEARRFLDGRWKILERLREGLRGRGFTEVTTPILQPQWGGAAARPFTTHHETLDADLYLRVAPELYLKRLLVGGYEKIFEIGPAFRNEGVSARHNPEFTILEAYEAFGNCETMMDLAENLIRETAAFLGKGTLQRDGRKADPAKPFRRLELSEALKKHGLDLRKITDGKELEKILEEKILPEIAEPVFLTGYPLATSPLAKARPGDPEIADRFELFLFGEEIANGYSELNDPQEQARRLEAQAKKRAKGEEEAMPYDREFVEALEWGMPPAGGLGIGVDRLCMILLGAASIREVLPFPLLRPSR